MGGGGGLRQVIRLLTAASVVVTVLSISSGAAADDEGGAGGTANAYVDDVGNPTAEARDGGSSGGRKVSRARSSCKWRVVLDNDNAFEMYDVDGNRIRSETGRWLEKWCEGRRVLVNGRYAIPERVRSIDPATLAQEARQSVPIPAPPIVTSPEADRGLYTRVRTWLWLDPAWWHPYTATADAGGVSTTVTAKPVRVVWSMGDGGQTVCEGPGVEWRQGMADHETYCSYVYKNSSSGRNGDAYTITVTVEFEVSWTSNVGSGTGLARITRAASRTVRVGEIQAVETG